MTPIDTAELERLAASLPAGDWVKLSGMAEATVVPSTQYDAFMSGALIQGDLRIIHDGDDPRDPISVAIAEAIALLPALLHEVLARRKAEAWQPIETAPKDGSDLLVWYDHDADPYHDPVNPKRLTDYAAWADGGDFLDGKGVCVAKWFPSHWKCIGDYGQGYWLPAAFFASENRDYERVVNAIYWRPLPTPPTPEAEGGCDA